MLINSLCLWLIAVPFAVVLTKFTDLKVPGIALADSFGSLGSLFLLHRCIKKTTDNDLRIIATREEKETSFSSCLNPFSLFQKKKYNQIIKQQNSELKKINVNRCGII